MILVKKKQLGFYEFRNGNFIKLVLLTSDQTEVNQSHHRAKEAIWDKPLQQQRSATSIQTRLIKHLVHLAL